MLQEMGESLRCVCRYLLDSLMLLSDFSLSSRILFCSCVCRNLCELRQTLYNHGHSCNTAGSACLVTVTLIWGQGSGIPAAGCCAGLGDACSSPDPWLLKLIPWPRFPVRHTGGGASQRRMLEIIALIHTDDYHLPLTSHF